MVKAPDCGPGERGFDSRRSPQKEERKLADAKRCDACQTYYIPRSGGAIDISGGSGESRFADLISKKISIMSVALSFWEGEMGTPVTHALDFCPNCTREALKQAMISFAKETG